MKAVCCTKEGEIQVLEMPEPKIIEPDDIKIKIAFNGICRDDIGIVEGLFGGMPTPMILGHEMSGTVVELGPKATEKGLKIGDRVTGNYSLYCGKCHYCNIGKEHACLNIKANMNSMAEYVVWNEKQIFKIPDAVSLEEACLTEPLSTCIRCIELANIHTGSTVAIFGAGGIGLMLVQLAIREGASLVVVIEPQELKRNIAMEVGADFVIDPERENVLAAALKLTNSLGFDTVLEASGNKNALNPAFNILGRTGTLVAFSLFDMEFEFPLNMMHLYWKEATVRAALTSPYTFPKAIALMPKLNLKKITNPIFSVEQAVKAFEARKTGWYPRVLIKF